MRKTVRPRGSLNLRDGSDQAETKMQIFTYEQRSGKLWQEGSVLGVCYSGHGVGVNNPDYERVPDVGPLPAGWYTIQPFFDDPGGKGPLVAHLVPDSDVQMFGRAGFMIHGDNAAMNRTASEGCIIAAHEIRLEIAGSVAQGFNRLLVVPDLDS
jgi:Protein of unknown function (DUF2778)